MENLVSILEDSQIIHLERCGRPLARKNHASLFYTIFLCYPNGVKVTVVLIPEDSYILVVTLLYMVVHQSFLEDRLNRYTGSLVLLARLSGLGH